MKKFYEKVLPSTGVYCVVAINKNKKPSQHFTETLAGVVDLVEQYKEDNNVFVAPNSFSGHSRLAKFALYSRSLFIDLDVGEEKPYKTKDEAIDALDSFLASTGLPEPARIDSGNGIHAYWPFDEDVAIAEWKIYAERFKTYCIDQGLNIDVSVTGDSARIMRCPDTYNFKGEIPKPTGVISAAPQEYDFGAFKEFLGGEMSVQEVLLAAPKGIDPEFEKVQKRLYDNIETSFNDIVLKSIDGKGCNQILHSVVESATLDEPMWYAALSIARNCSDWETAIHKLSEDHSGYNYEFTVKKANQTLGKPQSCAEFERHNSGGCEGCSFRGRVKNPLAIARRLKESPAQEEGAEADTVRPEAGSQEAPKFPPELRPYYRGANGGIYYVKPKKQKKDDEEDEEDDAPILILAHDLYPIRRMYSPQEGAILLMRCVLPNDPAREFPLTMKQVYSTEELKKVLTSQEAIFHPKGIDRIAEYIYKWATYMINVDKAELVRAQMGWTGSSPGIQCNEAFVIGQNEVVRNGTVRLSPASPMVRVLANKLHTGGTYQLWHESASMLNMPGLEMHAFAMLLGFGSPLMQMTTTTGGVVSYVGKSSAGKSGALYGALGIFGDPKALSVYESTSNGMQSRGLNLRNIMLGVDEASNKDALEISNFIHWITQGKTKIRMQSSVNAERETDYTASLIALITSNSPLSDAVQSLKASPDGEAARLIEFNIQPPTALLGNRALSTKIFDGLRLNFGFAGIPYIQRLYQIGDASITEKLEKWYSRFETAYSNETVYRFYRNMMAAAMTGGEIVNEMGLLDFDLERIFNVVVTEMIRIRTHTAKVNTLDYKDLIAEFYLNHQSSTLIIDDSRVITEPRANQLLFRVETHTGKCYVPKKVIKDYLFKMKVSTAEFELGAQAEGFLLETIKKRMTSGWAAGRDTPAVYAYCFKWDDIDALIEDAKAKIID
jgi:hypothetical protein